MSTRSSENNFFPDASRTLPVMSCKKLCGRKTAHDHPMTGTLTPTPPSRFS